MSLPENNQKRKIEEDIDTIVMNHPLYGKAVRWCPSNFLIGPKLGEGGFGKVHVAREKMTGALVALKILQKSRATTSMVKQAFVDEGRIMASLDHPNILKFFTWFHDQQRIYYIMELAAKGSVRDYMEKQPYERISAPFAAKITSQTASALAYCHRRDIIHRDVKPDNILLSSNLNVKLGDFGLARNTYGLHRRTNCGTDDYKPPEMVEAKPYDTSVDTWSLGVTLFEMVTGELPFSSRYPPLVEQRILLSDVVFPNYMEIYLVELLQQIFTRHRRDRPSMMAIQMHPWVRKYHAPDQTEELTQPNLVPKRCRQQQHQLEPVSP